MCLKTKHTNVHISDKFGFKTFIVYGTSKVLKKMHYKSTALGSQAIFQGDEQKNCFSLAGLGEWCECVFGWAKIPKKHLKQP